MQAFANVATVPVRRTAQGSDKTYWEFRAAESAKNDSKESATWYTVRVFQTEDPGFSKGDFIRIVGKLKLDVFMSREGKPMGVLVVMCYEAKRYEKPRSKDAGTPGAPHANCDEVVAPGAKRPRVAAKAAQSKPITVQEGNEVVDEGWLALVA